MEQKSDQKESLLPASQVREDAKQAIYGGGLAATVTLVGSFLVGRVSGGEAYLLLDLAVESTRSFSGTVTLAMGTILGLMLTLLSLSSSMNAKLKKAHYIRVRQIAWADALTLVGAILVYLLLNVPINEAELSSSDPEKWIEYMYFGTLVLSSLLGGAMITVILMLYHAVRDIIIAIAPDKDDPDIVRGEKE
jgi:hypothetical protein